MILIETFQEQSADFVQVVELEGVIVSLRIIFNTRIETWFINEYKEVETEQSLYGVKITQNTPILTSLKTRISLLGDFILLKEDEGAGDSVDYDNLNDGWNLYYLTEEELLAWEVVNGL